MRKTFVFAREEKPGVAWLERFNAGRAEAENWYLGQGRLPAPSPAECRAALAAHMPELLPRYDEACAMVGDDPLAHAILSHWRPAPSSGGCSQLVWLGEDGPALLRNYDFPPGIVSGRFESTAWFGREVIAAAQRPWGGVYDGMNADGLVASLTHGGDAALGQGFAIILMLRYVLETCMNVGEAIGALLRLPIAQSQNVTLLDRSGDFATLFMNPDRETVVTRNSVCANHQQTPPAALSDRQRDSVRREQVLSALLQEPGMSLEVLRARFLEPPLYSRRASFATVYSALYRPLSRSVDYFWPGSSCAQRLGGFTPGAYCHDFGELTA